MLKVWEKGTWDRKRDTDRQTDRQRVRALTKSCNCEIFSLAYTPPMKTKIAKCFAFKGQF